MCAQVQQAASAELRAFTAPVAPAGRAPARAREGAHALTIALC